MCEAGGSRHWCPANCASGTALVMAAVETICIPCHYPSGLRARPSLTPRPRLNFPKRHPSVSLSPEASPGRRHLRPLRRRSPFKVLRCRVERRRGNAAATVAGRRVDETRLGAATAFSK
ncbi:hypothetical protein C7M84_011304 [Penaeus vannamei]|uniref:Uncharacterized protein n=1 Tax=Penaeus vannamei TaxID=6689 RepID=A0A3R7NYL2_PENVA|nr:hypothetical protein C7M84_011304 [Penaeus vannamei]